MNKIGVIGGGAWGTALAQAAAKADCETLLWAREEDVVASINSHHVNSRFLKNIPLDPKLRATGDLNEILKSDAILLVSPAQHARSVLTSVAAHWPEGTPVVICSKGIEQGSLKLISDVTREVIPQAPVSVLSGPNFADEVAMGKPAAVTLACADEELGMRLMGAIGRPYFRPYFVDDIIGAQIGGALKNVLAIACGIVDGKGLGENARAGLMTRGLSELMRIGLSLGAKAETLMGLSGMGDLVLTCSSPRSRNMSLGVELGRGKTLADILQERQTVAEGVHTAVAAAELVDRLEVDAPIIKFVNDVVHQGVAIDSAIEKLLNRPFRHEVTGEDLVDAIKGNRIN